MPEEQLKLIKVPLGREIVIKKASFPPLENLDLNLLENPKLLKKDAPLIPLQPIKDGDAPRKGKKIIRNLGRKIEDKKREKRDLLTTAFASSDEDYSDEDRSNPDDDLEETHNAPPTIRIKSKTRRRDKIPEIDEEDEPLDEEDDEEYEDDEDEEEYEDEDEEDEEEEEPQETQEEKEQREKSEYTRKIKILKKQYPEKKIPDINEFTDLNTLKKIYTDEKWEIDIDKNHEDYRLYLMLSWMGMEMATTQWFGIDMKGLTEYHAQRMSKYDKLLIELGEKNHSKFGENLPVEIKLVGVVLLETLFFYVMKQASAKGGPNVSMLVQLLNGSKSGGFPGTSPSTTDENSGNIRKGKVRGPSVSPDEIRKMGEESEK